ncbi:MAG TPA: SDR family oxidoreductase [Gaiellaceae bacterium]|nr:SDR family oxidoreductase [Gaiellaceae bacterium]
MGRCEGKVVVVTGAAGGQGAADAIALAAEGATVVATDLHGEAPVLPAGIVYRPLDVSRPDDWSAFAKWLAEAHGRVDGLVNNAGIPSRSRLGEVTLDDWDRVLGVNLTGALLGIQTVAPLMGAGGSIVNVSSVAGLTGYHGAAYTVSKWGLRGLSRVASLELGARGIRVNTICPGYIETPMTATAHESFREANIAETPLGRTGTVDDIAPLVVFLISDESSYLSGAEIPVDGGLSAHGGAKSLSDAAREGA